jgi:hypothetical protein
MSTLKSGRAVSCRRLAKLSSPWRSSSMYVGKSRRKHLVAFEAKGTRQSSPEATMRALLKVIGALPPVARRAWKSAEARVFNVGYQAEEFVTLLHERPPGSGRWYAKDPPKGREAVGDRAWSETHSGCRPGRGHHNHDDLPADKAGAGAPDEP